MASKRGRRADGEGSITELPNGQFLARLPADKDGVRRKKACRTKTEAGQWIRSELGRRAQNLISTQFDTVASFADYWLNEVIKPHVKQKTFVDYRALLRRHVFPILGGERLDSITRPMVVRLYNKQREAGYSASTIKNTSLRLTALLDAAVEHHYIAVNPAKGIRLAKPEPRTRSLTVDEVKVVLGATHHYHNGLIYHLLLYLGLRKGEALGLRWQDLDWEAGVIRVHQQIQEIEGRVVVVPSLKTKASVRALPLPGVLIELLRSHQQQQEEERQIVGPDWKEYDLIFASEVGTPVAPTNVNRQWTLLRKRAGTPPITIHELRHTCATLLGEQGVEERVIGALLGHETQTITGRYAHVTMAMKQAAVERLVALYDA